MAIGIGLTNQYGILHSDALSSERQRQLKLQTSKIQDGRRRGNAVGLTSVLARGPFSKFSTMSTLFQRSVLRCHVTDDDNRLRFVRMSNYLSSWGADRPFAHLDNASTLANNIALTVHWRRSMIALTIIQTCR